MTLEEINNEIDYIDKSSKQIKKNLNLVEEKKKIKLEKEIKKFVNYSKKYLKKHSSASVCFQYTRKYTKFFERHFSNVYFFDINTFTIFAPLFSDLIDTYPDLGIIVNVNRKLVNDVEVMELRNIVVDLDAVWPGKYTIF